MFAAVYDADNHRKVVDIRGDFTEVTNVRPLIYNRCKLPVRVLVEGNCTR